MPGAINIIVSHPARLICVGMPKCGSSTLVESFLRLSGFDVPPREERSVARKAARTGTLAAAGLEIHDCYPVDITAVVAANPSYRVFTVTRDPYSRIWSAYFNKLNRYTKPHRYGLYLLGKLVQLLNGPRGWRHAEIGNKFLHRYIPFQVFLAELERLGVDIDPHFDLQVCLMNLDNVRYDRVLNLADLDESLPNMLAEFDLPPEILGRLATIPNANKRLATRASRAWDDPQIKAKIDQLYAEDIRRLGV